MNRSFLLENLSDMLDEIDARLTALEARPQAPDYWRKWASSEVEIKTAELDAAHCERDNLDAERKRLDAEITACTAERDAAWQENDELAAQRNALADERDALKVKLTNLRNYASNLEGFVKNQSEVIASLKEEAQSQDKHHRDVVASLTFELDQARQHADNRNKRVAVLAYENGNLKEENRHLRQIVNQEAK